MKKDIALKLQEGVGEKNIYVIEFMVKLVENTSQNTKYSTAI